MTSMRMLVRLVGGDPRACRIGIAGFTLASWSAGAVRAASWVARNHLNVRWADWLVLGCAAGSAAAFLLCLLSLLREKAKLPALAGLLVLGLGGFGSPLSSLKASTPDFSRLTWIAGALVSAFVLIVYLGLLLRRRRRPSSGSLGL